MNALKSPQNCLDVNSTSFQASEYYNCLQRKQKLECLIFKRINNIKYLESFNTGEKYWFNSIYMASRSRFHQHFGASKVKTLSLYHLGNSLSSIHDAFSSNESKKESNFMTRNLSALLQLFEEWEYFIAGNATKSMKFLLAKSIPMLYPQNLGDDPVVSESNTYDEVGISYRLKKSSSLYKYNNAIVFEYFKSPTLPFDIDHNEVLVSLCDILINLYRSFLAADYYKSNAMYEAIIKIDSKLRSYFIESTVKDITALCVSSIKPGLLSFRDGECVF